MGWTLADIRKKVRKLTGRFSTSALSNEELDSYINNYYVYTFPAETKLDTNQRYYEFNTIPGQEFYDFPSDFTNIGPPIWIDGMRTDFYQNPTLFFNGFPDSYTRTTLGAGNGVLTTFSQGAQNYPLIAGSVLVSDNVEVFTDDGAGVLTGDQGGTGTVNYTTGAISVTFNAAPALNQSVWASYIAYRTGTPQAVLLFNQQFRFYPIPDIAYHIRMVGYQIPTELTTATSTPVLEEWGPLIAYGAARNIFADNGEIDRYAEITALYKEELKYTWRRTLEDTSSQRAIPSY